MTRLISGVLLAAAFFSLVWYGSSTVLLFVALAVGAIAVHEYAAIAARLGAALAKPAVYAGTLATIAAVPFGWAPPEIVIALAALVIASAAMIGAGAPAEGDAGFGPSVRGAFAGGLALVYLGVPIGTLVALHAYGGRGAVVLLVATVAVSDTAQYYTGRTFGRRRLAPRLSPKKTIEGALGGLVAAPLFLYFAGPYFIPVAAPAAVAALGVALVAAGIAGDLFESMLKRAADMKDSSTLIPGHGGVLDRIDALLFAAPVFYVYVRWVYAP